MEKKWQVLVKSIIRKAVEPCAHPRCYWHIGGRALLKANETLLLWVAPQAAHRLQCHWRQFLCCCLFLLLLLLSCFSEVPLSPLSCYCWVSCSPGSFGHSRAGCFWELGGLSATAAEQSDQNLPRAGRAPSPPLSLQAAMCLHTHKATWVTSPVCHKPPLQCEWNKRLFQDPPAISLISSHTVAVICFWEGFISSKRGLYLYIRRSSACSHKGCRRSGLEGPASHTSGFGFMASVQIFGWNKMQQQMIASGVLKQLGSQNAITP